MLGEAVVNEWAVGGFDFGGLSQKQPDVMEAKSVAFAIVQLQSGDCGLGESP